MAKQSDYARYGGSLEGPIPHSFDIVPSDTDDLGVITRSIYIGTSGDLTVEMLSGEVVTYVGVLGGVSYPLRLRKVMATGTTASNLIGEV